MNFKKRLKELRIQKGLTQDNLASILKYGRTAIANYESGRSEPSHKDLNRIADYFNVSTDYLLGRIDDPNLKIIEKEKLPKELAKYVDHIEILKGYDVSDISPEELKYAIEFAKKIKGK